MQERLFTKMTELLASFGRFINRLLSDTTDNSSAVGMRTVRQRADRLRLLAELILCGWRGK